MEDILWEFGLNFVFPILFLIFVLSKRFDGKTTRWESKMENVLKLENLTNINEALTSLLGEVAESATGKPVIVDYVDYVLHTGTQWVYIGYKIGDSPVSFRFSLYRNVSDSEHTYYTPDGKFGMARNRGKYDFKIKEIFESLL